MLRRPGAGPPPGQEVVIDCASITLDQCRGLREIVVVDGSYWEQKVDAVGTVQSVHLEGPELYLQVKVNGARTEDLLKAVSGLPGRLMKWHLCRADCRGVPHEEGVLHVKKLREAPAEKEAWMTNLMEEAVIPPGETDELQLLRRQQAAMRPQPQDKGPGDQHPGEEEAEEPAKKSKKKKKKKGVKIDSTRSLAEVYKHTGLDPDPKVRRRIRRKAAKLAKSKAKGSSSSSESSGSSTGESNQDPSLFGTPGRVQLIGKKCPGVLLASAAEEAAEALLTGEGGIWDPNAGPVMPVFSRYFRAHLQAKMSPAMAREALTLAVGLDMGLRGKVADLLDLLGQRLKALELQANGSHYTVAQQCELLPKEGAAISTQVEIQQAAKRARDEGKTKMESAGPYGHRTPYQGKGEDSQKGGKKGNKGKYGKGENKKGDSGKEDAKKTKGA